MSKTPELVPCPCCGEAGATDVSDSYRPYEYTGCAYCGIYVDSRCVADDEERSTQEIWNTRVYPPEVQAAIERAAPKKPAGQRRIIGELLLGYCPTCGAPANEDLQCCQECGQRLDWSEE